MDFILYVFPFKIKFLNSERMCWIEMLHNCISGSVFLLYCIVLYFMFTLYLTRTLQCYKVMNKVLYQDCWSYFYIKNMSKTLLYCCSFASSVFNYLINQLICMLTHVISKLCFKSIFLIMNTTYYWQIAVTMPNIAT